MAQKPNWTLWGLSLFFAVLATLSGYSCKSNAADGFQWQHFGADPYASSRDEAMRTREGAFHDLGFPKEVIGLLMEATKKPGEKIRLTNGDKLAVMLSKGGVIHRNVTVAFVAPPISGKMEYAAPAEMWQVSWQGETYTVARPEICNNWSRMQKMSEECYELSFNAPIGGKGRWGVATANGPFLPSACNAQRQGDGPWMAWYGDCDSCVLAPVYLEYMKRDIGPNAQRPHKFLYSVTHTKQTLRFSAAVLSADVYICLEDANGKKTCGVLFMRPQDWKGRRSVEVPEIWMWEGDTRCPPQ